MNLVYSEMVYYIPLGRVQAVVFILKIMDEFYYHQSIIHIKVAALVKGSIYANNTLTETACCIRLSFKQELLLSSST